MLFLLKLLTSLVQNLLMFCCFHLFSYGFLITIFFKKPLGPIGSADTEFLVALVSEFSSIICLETAHQMVKYLAQLPDEKTDGKFILFTIIFVCI